MDKKVFFSLVAFSVLLFFLYLLYTIVAPFLTSLGWAALTAILTFPLYRKLHSRLHGRDLTAAGIMTALVVLTLIIPVIGLGYSLARELAQVYNLLEETKSIDQFFHLENMKQLPAVAPLLERIRPYIGQLDIDLNAAVLSAMKTATSLALGYSTEILKNFISFLVKLILTVITLFFIYKDWGNFQQEFWSMIPLEKSDCDLLENTIKRILKAVIFGIVLTCLVQGMLGGIGFWFTGLPLPLLFGAMMTLCALIPFIGTALIWLPAVSYLLLQGETTKGIILLLWCVFIVGTIDNFIRPIFISSKAGTPLLLIIFGALGGLIAFGPSGAVFGPVLLVMLMALYDIYKLRIPGKDTGSDSGN